MFCIKSSAGPLICHSPKMLRYNTCIVVLASVALVVAKAKPPPTPSPWAKYVKATPGPWANSEQPGASLLSAGAALFPGKSDSITVPYMPKGSPFFPKFVDPKAMIATKTGMVSNFLNGFGPVDYPYGAAPFAQYSPAPYRPPVLYSAGVDDETKGIQDSIGEQDKLLLGGIYGPGGPFGASKFPWISPFVSQFGPGSYNPAASSAARRRRSVSDTESESAQAELPQVYKPAVTPKETTPGMFGLFGPYVAPVPVDPAAIAAKKTAFLDSLFKSLASSTTAATAVESEIATTEIPIPKSTIVPPDFWLPSAIIPGPGEYTSKVATFLDKLFEHIANKTAATAAAAAATDATGKPLLARSLTEDPDRAKILYEKSIEDLKTVGAAKDAIVESILSELGDLKTDMMSTLNDYILYVKTAPAASDSKKPLKKPSPFAAFWAPPTPDTSLPFKQRMAALGEVFDMLTGLERNITMAVQDVIQSATEAPIAQDSSEENVAANGNYGFYGPAGNYPAASYSMMAPIAAYNATLFDALKARIADLEKVPGFNKPIGAYSYPAPAKRAVGVETPEDSVSNKVEQFKRQVEMQMHQGYQSMPPGTIETVQAGGGSVPGHQGGGIKLLDYPSYDQDWSKWAEQFGSPSVAHGHHHNRH